MNIHIGVISDIHAELPALQRALDLFDKFGIDRVVCAGDLVEKGSQGDAVVRLIEQRAIPTVMGNHDAFAAENQRWLLKHADPNHSNYPRLLQGMLSDEAHRFLGGLPQTVTLDVAGQRILMAHGTPARNDEYLFFHSPDARYRQLIREHPASVIIVGHTHEPMLVRVRPSTWIINPGSVCFQQSHGSGTCAILSLPDFNVFVLDLRTGSKVAVQYRQI